MPNRSNYQRWFMERYNATNESRDEVPAAPAARARAIGTVNPYWIQKKKIRDAAKAQRRKGASHKPQAHKLLDKPIDLWDKVI